MANLSQRDLLRSTSLQENDIDEILAKCDGAYSPTTLSSYRQDLEAFRAWCRSHSEAWLPARSETVARFIDSQVSDHRLSTIKRRLCAVSFAHRMLDIPDPTKHSSVHLSMRRAGRARPSRPEQVRGLKREILEKILDTPSMTLASLRDVALICVGYDTLCRSAEIGPMQVGDLRRDSSGALSILIPRSKADISGKGRIGHLSPGTVERLTRWLEAAGISEGPMFQGLHLARPSGQALSMASIRRIVKRAVQRSGFPKSVADEFSGHSMRIGAAQDMMVAGFDILAIMQAGGWTTPHVAARYVENASTRRLHERRWAALGLSSIERSSHISRA